VAPEIKMKNLQGKKIKLSDEKGKIVLIYFWASWSEHCRAENVAIEKVLQHYQNKNFQKGNGFDVFAIALEKNEDDWFAAVQKDGISNFINLSEVKFMDSKVAQQYNIKVIPMTYLIDGEGGILATGLNAESLENTLAQMLDENTRIIK
jgi:thiol-disulfide isomerase/thioredoxin